MTEQPNESLSDASSGTNNISDKLVDTFQASSPISVTRRERTYSQRSRIDSGGAGLLPDPPSHPIMTVPVQAVYTTADGYYYYACVPSGVAGSPVSGVSRPMIYSQVPIMTATPSHPLSYGQLPVLAPGFPTYNFPFQFLSQQHSAPFGASPMVDHAVVDHQHNHSQQYQSGNSQYRRRGGSRGGRGGMRKHYGSGGGLRVGQNYEVNNSSSASSSSQVPIPSLDSVEDFPSLSDCRTKKSSNSK